MDYLRETLRYADTFREKVFCIIVDAEPAENYDYATLANDFLLLTTFCKIKIVVIIGCFPNKEKSRPENLKKIDKVSNELAKNLPSAKIVGDIDKLSPSVFQAMIKKQPILVVNFQNADSSGILKSLSIVNSLLTPEIITKIVVISNHDGIFGARREFLPQMTVETAKTLLKDEIITGELAIIVMVAIFSIEDLGIRRIHLVNGIKPDGLISELFTKDGFGTMLYADEYREIRQATESDVGEIKSLISFCQHVVISFKDFSDIYLATVDFFPVACAKVVFFPEEQTALVPVFVANPHYVGMAIKLLGKVFDISRQQNCLNFFVVVPEIVPWWMPSDFTDGDILAVPAILRQKLLNKKFMSKKIR